MNKILIVLCVSVLLLGGIVGSADAYTGLAEAVFFYEGIDLDFGEVYQDKSVLIIIYAPVEEALAPPVDFDDFDSKADIYFEFTELTDPISLVFVLEENNQPDITGVATLTGADTFSDLTFDEGLSSVLFDENDIVVLRITEFEYITIEIVSINLEEFKLTLEITHEIIPEPSTLLLLGLGLLGFAGFRRWKRKGKRTMTLLLLITIVSTTGVLLLCGAESVAAQETFKITIIKKCLTIALSPEGELVLEEIECASGTVMVGDNGVCGPGCTRIEDVPFSKNTALILKAGGADVEFERWEKADGPEADGTEVEGVFKVNDNPPGHFYLYAIFRKLPEAPSEH